jgi:alpha-methylacyl-CoA racemase
MLALRIVAPLHLRHSTGQGSVVDQSIVDGAALVASKFRNLVDAGVWTLERGAILLDGGAPFYRAYEARDGKYVAVGAIEEPFYQALLKGLGLESKISSRAERSAWPSIEKRPLPRQFVLAPRRNGLSSSTMRTQALRPSFF